MEGKVFSGDSIPNELYETREFYYKPWDVVFRLRDMTGIDAYTLNKLQFKMVDRKVSFEVIDPAHRIVRCLIDEKGERIFKDDDYAKIAKWPSRLTTKLTQIIAEICGDTEETYGELEKNLE